MVRGKLALPYMTAAWTTPNELPVARSGLRILWQNEHYPDVVKGGGGAINTYYIVTALQRLGHNPVILARGPHGVGIFRESVNGTSVIRFSPPTIPDPLWPLWPLLEPHYLQKAITEIVTPFDMFVCVDAPYALSIKRLYPRRPLIFRVEGTRKSYEASVAPPPREARWSLEERKQQFFGRLLVLENDLMDRLAWRRCDAIVVKSEFMKRELLTVYGVPPEKIHVVPNGVDFNRYAFAQATQQTLDRLGNPDGTKVVITFCGRLVRMKNLSYLLRAFARMRFRNCCVLALVGEGDERKALEEETQRLGIASQVRFLGYTQRVEEFLAASDIFVLPSTYEPFGNALLEAMAAGLPCVALRPDFKKVRTASPEIIVHDETGYLVDSQDPDDLSRTLDRLAGDPSLRRRIGETAQRYCRDTYSWHTCAQQYVELAAGLSCRLSSTKILHETLR